MKPENYYTQKAFKNSVTVCCILFYIIVYTAFARGTAYAHSFVFVEIPALIAVVVALIGFFRLIFGRKEKKTIKFFVAIFINGLLAAIFLIAIIMNSIDVVRYLFFIE